MRTEPKEINGVTYTCRQLPASVGCRVAARLANALSAGVKALPEDGFEVSPAQLAAFIAPILSDEKLADTLAYLCTTFAERTIVNTINAKGEPVQFPLSRIFDDHFADDYEAMVLWLVFSLQLSLSSFFRSVRGLVASAQRAAQSSSKSPNSPETNGLAGESPSAAAV